MNSKSGGFLISSVWLRGADFLPDSSTARAGNPDRVFLKAHSGRGILYSGHRYLIPSIFSATTRERAPLAVWHLLGEMTMRIDRFHHRWQTRRENIALGLLINICSRDGWSIPASDPLTQNATTCVGKSSSGASAPPPSAVMLLPGSRSHSSSLLSPRLESLIAHPKQVLCDGLAPCPETASEILLDVSNPQHAGGREDRQGR